MKLIVILAVIALCNGEKLDNTYLPPSHATSSGGSENFLQTPALGQSSNQYYRNNGFAHNSRGLNRNGVAQSSNEYAQDRNSFIHAGNNFARNGNGFTHNGNEYAQDNGSGRERAQAAFERNAAILRQDTQNDGHTYAFAYETENGIVAEESGVAINGVEAQGGFSYTGDDGQVYSIRYTADQNGFIPQGDHLPTPPPVPEEILRALEQNARDEVAGIYDDGSYNEAKYNSNNNYENSNNFNSGNNFNNGNSGNNYNNDNNYNKGNNYYGNNNDEDTVVTNNALLGNGNRPGFGSQAVPSYNHGFRTQGAQVGIGNRRTDLNGPTSQLISFRNQNNRGFGNQNSNNVNKAYLPPLNNQRSGSNERNAFGRRQPSFNARNGY